MMTFPVTDAAEISPDTEDPMRKLSLDQLVVESFEISREQAGRGTVVAHETGTQRVCTEGMGTCEYSCGIGGCGGSAGCGTHDCNGTNDYTCATAVHQRICVCNG
jgi:hypothetical protein